MGSQPERAFGAGTIHEVLGIEAVSIDKDRVELAMEVGPSVHQPMGMLHGGASAVIAESAASMGAFVNCEEGVEYAVGTDLSISHLRSKSDGTLRAIAVPERIGRTLQVWTIDVIDETGKKVAVARCTLAVRRFDGG